MVIAVQKTLFSSARSRNRTQSSGLDQPAFELDDPLNKPKAHTASRQRLEISAGEGCRGALDRRLF